MRLVSATALHTTQLQKYVFGISRTSCGVYVELGLDAERKSSRHLEEKKIKKKEKKNNNNIIIMILLMNPVGILHYQT